jgi:hypothetical protein
MSRRVRGATRVWLAAAFVLAAAASVLAQATATVSGRVVDQDGAVLPGVSITVTNMATGAVRETFSNAEGLYVVPALLRRRCATTSRCSPARTCRWS